MDRKFLPHMAVRVREMSLPDDNEWHGVVGFVVATIETNMRVLVPKSDMITVATELEPDYNPPAMETTSTMVGVSFPGLKRLYWFWDYELEPLVSPGDGKRDSVHQPNRT